jgi:hypothetical protein
MKKDTSMKRVGNEEARPGKRAAFKEAKAERSGLADSVLNAFSTRGARDYESTKTQEGEVDREEEVYKTFKKRK